MDFHVELARTLRSSVVKEVVVYLIIGDPSDSCVLAVRTALEKRGSRVRVGLNPFDSLARLRWRFDTRSSKPNYVLEERVEPLEGVLVRNFAALLDSDGWTPEDAAYLHSEGMAALLAWLHALPCPVVGRPSDDAWYRPQRPLPEWVGLLAACGLDTPEVIVTNAPEAETFAAAWSGRAVYQPLTSARQYVIEGEAWMELSRVMEHVPVCLSEPLEGPVGAVTLVGEGLFWTNPPTSELEHLGDGVRRVAARLESDFVQLHYHLVPDGAKFTSVNLLPILEAHEPSDRDGIVFEIVRRLDGSGVPRVPGSARRGAEVNP